MRGVARGVRVELDGAPVDAIVRCEGRVLRTARPDAVLAGIAQVRRAVRTDALVLHHLVFAPAVARPLFLGLVRIGNPSDAPRLVEYTEIWRVSGEAYEAKDGASVCASLLGPRALADVSPVLRAHVPEPVPEDALALELRLALPARAVREVAFAYVVPDADEDPAPLVRAWRGEVRTELARTLAAWQARLDGKPDVLAYRRLDT